MKPMPRMGLVAKRGSRVFALLGLLAMASPAPAAEPDFNATWRDGKAELDGYRLTLTRYGEPRAGTAVAIYVTEPFDRVRHVKVDDPASEPARVVDVLKLNFVRRFQTGIYDYHTMSSLFVRSDDLAPLKLVFASGEWCGQVYEELNWGGTRLTARLASYFEGESGERSFAWKPGALVEDELMIRLRGLHGHSLGAGEKETVPFLASAFYRRLTHQPLEWTSATIARATDDEFVVVPAGRFACHVYVVRVADGREGRFWIEAVHPHRVVRWRWTAAAGGRRGRPAEALDAGELTGSDRLEYWKLHQVGGEAYLERLGLAPVR